MTSRTTFSICIPAYKSKHLAACIQSILNQTVSDFELIVLNDCSPEPVKEITEGIHDDRIRYYENEVNVGAVRLVANWNKCLSIAKGDYIMIMGDDDLLEPDYLEEFLKLMDAYPNVEVFHCRSKIINDAGAATMLSPSCPAHEDVYDAIWHRINQLRSNYISDFVYRTKTLRERGGFYDLPLAWGSDDITAFIATAIAGIAHTNKPVFKYRSHGASISSNATNGTLKLEADKGYEAWLREFLKQTPDAGKDQTVYHHLVQNISHYMRRRKVFTMTKLMQSNGIAKLWAWSSARKNLDLSLKDIVLAFVKSRKKRRAD